MFPANASPETLRNRRNLVLIVVLILIAIAIALAVYGYWIAQFLQKFDAATIARSWLSY